MKLYITILFLFIVNNAVACGGGFGDFTRMEADASHIFTGTVVDVQTLPDSYRYRFATVAVREVWLGAVPDTVVVAASTSSCGVAFKLGVEYVFLPRAPRESVIDEWATADLDPKIWREGVPMSVWTGSCETYERAGEAAHITLGSPRYVANGLTSRTAKLEALLDILEDPSSGNIEEAILTLGLCDARLIADANSDIPEDRARFERAVRTLLKVGLANREKSERVYAQACYTASKVGPAALFALPMLLSLYDETFATEFDDTYWMMLKRIGRDDPRLGAKLVEVAMTSTVDEIRAFALGQFWIGNIAWHDGAQQPDGFIADPAPQVRRIAIRTLAQRTSSPDSLAFLAQFVLLDIDVSVIKVALPTIINRLEGDLAVRWMAEGLNHPDSGVRWAALGSKPLDHRDVPTRCAILKVAMESPYEDVRNRAVQYWKRLGADCN